MRGGSPARAPLQRAALPGTRGDLQRGLKVWGLTSMGALQAPTCFGSWLPGSMCDNTDLGSSTACARLACWPPACQQAVHVYCALLLPVGGELVGACGACREA